MFLGKVLRCVIKGEAKTCVSASNKNHEVDLQERAKYYKTQWEKQVEKSDWKPQGWDEAKPTEKIPGPKPLPIIGNTWRFKIPKIGTFYKMDFIDITKKLYEQYGDIVTYKGSLYSTLIVLFNPADFGTMFRNEGTWPVRKNFLSLESYRKKYEAIVPNFGLVSSQGSEWYRLRSIINPILVGVDCAKPYTTKMDLVAEQLVDNMKYLSKQNKHGEMPENFMNELYKWGLESIAVVTLNQHLGCLKRSQEISPETRDLIQSVIEIPQLIFKLDCLPSLWRYWGISTPEWKKFVKLLNFVVGVNVRRVNEALDKLEKEPKSDQTSLSVFEALMKGDPQVAIGMSIDMMLAGIDSTGKVLGATLYYLGKNPEKQTLLRQEAKKLLPSKNTPVTNEILEDARYLRGTVKEILRLAPVSAGTLRTTQRNLILSGYQIPKGTNLLAANLTLCFMDKHFPRAKEFIPERWLVDDKDEMSAKRAHTFIYSPFGHGARTCVGKRFAELELKVALLKIIRNFEISWPHEDMTFVTTTVYGLNKPLKIRVKPVNN